MIAPVALLLAAGYSTRFGRDKLREPLADGTPMAVAACRCYQAAGLIVHTVLRPDQIAVQDLLAQAGVQVHISEKCQEGMGSSLAAGVAATSSAGGWIVGLADMPFVSPDTIAAVRRAIEIGTPAAAPQVNGRRGHPVGFSPAFVDSLMCLRGDEGARRLVQAAGASVVLIPCEDPGALHDIDQPQDLPG